MSPDPAGGDASPSTWLRNPVTGEVIRFAATDPGGGSLEADLWLQPGAALSLPHIHDFFSDRFHVQVGEIALRTGNDPVRSVGPGDGPVEVPAGVLHDWWNAGDGVAHAIVEARMTSAAGAAVPDRFIAMFEVVFSLAVLGEVDRRGAPRPLWLAAIAREYRDVLRMPRPPAPVQTALFGPLAAVARRTGRDPLSPGLHGPDAPCRIPEPDPAELATLLADRAGVAAQR